MPMRAPSTTETLSDRDERLLEAWKNARTASSFEQDKALTALLDSLAGPINQAINVYRAAPVPTVTLELEAKRIATQACRDWKPGVGTLAGYVNTVIRQRLYRYVAQHQNVARLPEAQTRMIGTYQRALSDLTDRYGTPPSTAQLADHLGVPLAHIARLRKSLRQDLLESGSDTEAMDDHTHDPDFERVSLAYYSLTEQEKSVFDLLMGAHGQPRVSPGEAARRLKLTPARISQLKTSIAQKLQPYLAR